MLNQFQCDTLKEPFSKGARPLQKGRALSHPPSQSEHALSQRGVPSPKGARPFPKGRALPQRGAPSPKGALLPNGQNPDQLVETDRGLTHTQ